MKHSTTIKNDLLGDMRILQSGVPCYSNRGYFGYCTVVLFPLAGHWALFDTGHYSDRHLLLEALDRVGVSCDDIKHVVLSHLHFDHSLNLSMFKNASVFISQAELNYAEDVIAGKVKDYSIPDFWPHLLKKHEIQSVKKVLELSQSLRIECLPGHTPGCLVLFYEGPSTVAVCGDVVKNAWEALTGEAAITLFSSTRSRKSIEYVVENAGVIIPGHDRPFLLNENGIEFLGSFQWKIFGSIYPREHNTLVFDLKMRSGIIEK